MRLRRLRNSALRAREIAAVYNRCPPRPHSLYSRSAASCWRIARTITGVLRAQPYRNYQRGPGNVRGVYHRLSAAWLGIIARYWGRSLQSYSGELGRLVRELDDARALTWSADLSDALGRYQMQIRRLVEEVDAAGARREAGLRHKPAARAETRAPAANWPYLGL